MSWLAQSFYVRLLTLVDDYGRYEADASLLRSHAFPLREDIRAPQVQKLCLELQANQLANFYNVEGKQYLQLTNWTERARAPVSKYPSPLGQSENLSCDNIPQDSAGNGRIPQPSASSFLDHRSSIRTPHAGGWEEIGDIELPEVLRSDGFKVVWTEWVAYRRGIGKVKSPLDMLRRQLDELAGWGEEKALAALKTSMARGWTGFFEPKGMEKSGGSDIPIRSVMDADNVLKSIQSAMERIRDDNSNRVADASSPQGWRLKLEALEQIKKLRVRREEVQKLKAGLR